MIVDPPINASSVNPGVDYDDLGGRPPMPIR